MAQLKAVSDDWLMHNDHKEQGFAMGYFDESYLQDCTVHSLHDEAGQIVAFANQLPNLRQLPTATVDLIRYQSSADDAMPYLLAEIIKAVQAEGYGNFDLGFVPFASTTGCVTEIGANYQQPAVFSTWVATI